VALPRGVRFVVGFMFVVLVGVSLVRASQPVRRHVEYAGAIYHIAAFANRFGPEDLVIFESRDSGSADLHILAVPLDYLYGRQVLLLRSARPDRSKFRALLEWAQARYHNVYFVGASGTDLASRTIAVTPVANLYFGLPEYESALNAYPKEVGQKPFYFGIYRFERNITGTAPSVIDIGEFDDLNVVRFHPKERMDNTFRWTGPVSYITLPAVTARTHSIALWMSDDPRPDSVPPAHVTVYLNDQFLGDARVGLDLRPYEFAVTPEVARSAAAQADPARLRLLSTVWNPRKTLGAGDDRSQGVMVDKVEVR
jgi:hypothetical protein